MAQITEIGTYSFRSTYGQKHARMATFVKFSDGEVIRFMEKLAKREASKAAMDERTRKVGRQWSN